MFCHKCGTKLLDEATFCHKCGAKLPTDTVSPSLSVKGTSEEERVRSILRPYEEAAQKGPFDYQKMCEGRELLATNGANNPFAETYWEVLWPYYIAYEAQYELQIKWLTNPIEFAASHDVEAFLKKDYHTLLKQFNFPNTQIDQFIHSDALIEFWDEFIFMILLAAYIYHGKLHDFKPQDIVAYEISRGRSEEFHQKIMADAKDLADVIRQSPKSFGIKS